MEDGKIGKSVRMRTTDWTTWDCIIIIAFILYQADITIIFIIITVYWILEWHTSDIFITNTIKLFWQKEEILLP